MDFTIVKIMNELGVSEEEARALVEFDLKHKKVEEAGKIEKSVVEVAGAEQLTKSTKSTKLIENSETTKSTKNTENTKSTKDTKSTKNTELTENPKNNENPKPTKDNQNIELTNTKNNEKATSNTISISAKEISETRNVEIFEFENENPKSKFKKQSFISEIENQILENYIGIEFPQNLNSTSVSFKVDGKYYTLKLTEHKSRPAGFKE